MNKIFAIILLFSVSFFAQEFNPEYEWFTIEGKHVKVHFHEGTERTAKIVLKIAEEVWEPITSLYGFEPETIHYIIKDIDDYSNGATYFFDNKIEIWASALDFDLRGSHNWLRNVITHEFVHMVNLQTAMKMTRRIPAFYLQYLHYQDERRPDVLYGYPNTIISYPVAGINVPNWLAEGTAQYQRKELNYDSWDTHRDMILRSYILGGNLLSWNEMGVFGKTSLGNESVYNLGLNLVDYIARVYGEDKLKQIFAELKNPLTVTVDKAIENVLGIEGIELYNQWKLHLEKDYQARISPVLKNEVKGTEIELEGFANLHPHFYENGKKILYLSNKGMDYLSQTSVYLYDISTKEKKKILQKVNSNVEFIPNTNKILYAKLSTENPKWTNIHDLFIYNLDNEEETRITFGLRANNPSISSDGKKVVFLFQKDGTTNLGTVTIDGKNFRQLTFYDRGEQVFNPVFSPKNDEIYFGIIKRNNQDIAKIDTNGANFEFVLNSESDERNPTFGKDGKFYFSDDKTGIFNIYEYDFPSKQITQITNVTGGSFYQDVDSEGNIVFANYTSTGYKLNYLSKNERKQISAEDNYLKTSEFSLPNQKTLPDLEQDEIAYLKNYDDFTLPEYEVKKYKGEFTNATLIPFVRYDDYNTTSNAFEKFKLGLYFTSSDYLNRYDIFAGFGMNSRFERDAFLMFNYRDKIPFLIDLGLKPQISLELYNVTRKANADIYFNVDSTDQDFGADYHTQTDITYNLLEFDFAAKQNLLSEDNFLEFRYILSKYSATIGSFLLPGNTYLYPTTNDTYLYGHNFQLTFNHTDYLANRNMCINPIGRKIELKLNYEMNNYNSEGEYTVENGALKPVYGDFYFPRLEMRWLENFRVFDSHSLNFKLKYGTIFGPPQPKFFDFYIGGLNGMRGFPFYSLGGNEMATLNVSYRFPLFREIDYRLGLWYLDKMYFTVFGDVGNAWNEGMLKFDELKKDVGAELRMKLVSFYIFPTAVFFSWSYSFDQVEEMVNKTKVISGKESRFYFGVLFDFELY